MNMHTTQNSLKYVRTLQEDYKKKCKEINNECNASLDKIKEIDDLIKANESSNIDNKDLEIMRFQTLIKPFLAALYNKDKVPAYVFEALHFLISGFKADNETVVNCVGLLQKHLNTNKEQGVKIIRILHLFLGYDCVVGDVIANIFYTCMTLLDYKNAILTNTSKVLCKQIIYVIFIRFRTAHMKYKEDGILLEEYNIYQNDCKVILNDICEYLNTYAEMEEHFILSLDFLEQILKSNEIFDVIDIKEIFVKIINKYLICKENTMSGPIEDKINRVTFMVIKSKAFLHESHNLILKSANVLHLFDSELLKFVMDNENNKNAYLEVLRKISNDEDTDRKNLLTIICNLVAYLKQEKKLIDTIEDNELQIAEHNEIFTFTSKLFIEYLRKFKYENNEFAAINDIFLYYQNEITHLHSVFEMLIKAILFHSGDFVLEVSKYFTSIKDQLTVEWSMLIAGTTDRTKELQAYLLEHVDTFTSKELFYLLNATEDKDVLKNIYNHAIKNNIDITPLVLTILNCFYEDLDEFVLSVSEIVDNINICDEILKVIFSAILLRLGNRSINEIANNTNGYEYVFEHDNFAKKQLKQDSIVTSEIKQKLVITVYNYIRVDNEKIDTSWDVIINILADLCNDELCSEEVFNTCQVITENFYPLIDAEGRRKLNKILCTISNINIDKVNLVLQVLNVLNSISKHIENENSNIAEFKDVSLSVISIILQNRSEFNDVFETGFNTIYNMCTKQSNVTLYGLNDLTSFIYESILPEIISKGKEIFDTKILDSNEFSFDERKRFKTILQIILCKVNNICKMYNSGSKHASAFVDKYLNKVKQMICFANSENIRGFDIWKNEIALDCIDAYEFANDDHFMHINYTIENIPLLYKDNSAKDLDENAVAYVLYYKISVYAKLIETLENNKSCKVSFDDLSRLFEIQDSIFRGRLFETINKKSKSENAIEYYTKWLKYDDNDIVMRVLGSIHAYFFENTNNEQPMKDNSICNAVDLRLRLNNSFKQEKITFASENGKTGDSGKIIDMLKTLVLLAHENESFWVKSITCVNEILNKYKEDRDVVDSMIKMTQYLCQKETESANSIPSFYGMTSEIAKTKQNSVNERIKEKVLISYVDTYLKTITHHLYKYKDDEKARDEFAASAFAFIYDISFVKPGNFREKLNNKCLSALFRYSRFTKDLLVSRVKQSLVEYSREIHTFKNLYPRCKKAEIKCIFEYLSENPLLVKDLKLEIIDCLSYNDQEIIDKIRICLKKGL